MLFDLVRGQILPRMHVAPGNRDLLPPGAIPRHRRASAGHDHAPPGPTGHPPYNGRTMRGLDDERGWPSLSGHARLPLAPTRADGRT